MTKEKRAILLMLMALLPAVWLLFPADVDAYRPVVISEAVNSRVKDGRLSFDLPVVIGDPTEASLLVYDRLSGSGDVKLYSFTPKSNDRIPVEVFVPVHRNNYDFYPVVSVIAWGGSFAQSVGELPYELPSGFLSVVSGRAEEKRTTFFVSSGFERMYRGGEILYPVVAGNKYYISVYEPSGRAGDFALGIGPKDRVGSIDSSPGIKEVLKIKFGLVGGYRPIWSDYIGLFFIIVGFVLGIGVSTVADFQSILGWRSEYWSETAVRTQKIAGPVEWLGLFMALSGEVMFFWADGWTGIPSIISVVAVLLVLNNIYVSYAVRPRLVELEESGRSDEVFPLNLRLKVLTSSAISFICWWSTLLLLVWYIAVR